MTGSLQTKNGKYYAVLDFYDDANKRKQKWINTGYEVKGNNERKAQQALKKLEREYAVKKISPFDDVLFVDYINQWLEMIRMQVDEVTLQGYEGTAKKHLIPYFEPLKLKLNEVTPSVLQKYYNYKHKSGRLDGKGGLAAKSVKQHHVVIYQTLKDALRKNLVLYNPAERITLPKMEHFVGKFYSAEQIHALFDALNGEPLLPLIRVTVIYGLRRSELLGLKWDSINFTEKKVIIKHTVSKCTKVVEKDKTKNHSSFRGYPMMPEIEDIFKEAKCKEITNRHLFGQEYQDNEYVFKWDDGHAYSPDFISQKFHKLLEKHNLPMIRFHDLRHSCASLLIDMGYDLKDIQEWLGHADVKMTGNVYGHLSTKRKNGIAEAFSNNIKMS